VEKNVIQTANFHAFSVNSHAFLFLLADQVCIFFSNFLQNSIDFDSL